VLFPQQQCWCHVKLTNHLHLVPRSIMSATTPPLPIHLHSMVLNKHGQHDTWGSHSSKAVDAGLLGCIAVWTCSQAPVFWRNTLPPPS
jgi:hypothetical protein